MGLWRKNKDIRDGFGDMFKSRQYLEEGDKFNPPPQEYRFYDQPNLPQKWSPVE